MITSILILAVLQIAAQQPATPAPQVVAINMPKAIASTQEGIRAADHMRAEWSPELAALEKREAAIGTDRVTLERESRKRHGIWPFRHAMSPGEKARRMSEIERRARAIVRERDDDQAGFEVERTRVVNQIAGRMQPIIGRYTKDHGYSLVPDSGIDLTDEIVRLYDLAYPVK